MDRAIGFLFIGAGRVGEVNAAGSSVERQVIWAAQRLAVRLGRGGLEFLASGVQMQERVPAGVANQVAAVRQDLMSVRRAGLCPG